MAEPEQRDLREMIQRLDQTVEVLSQVVVSLNDREERLTELLSRLSTRQDRLEENQIHLTESLIRTRSGRSGSGINRTG